MKKNIFVIPTLMLFILGCTSSGSPSTPVTSQSSKTQSYQVQQNQQSLVRAKLPAKGLVRPPYPAKAESLRLQGVTKLNLFLGKDGNVKEAVLMESSGSKILDDATIDWALKKWVFIPCKTSSDEPAECWYDIKYSWRLLEK